MISPNIVFQCDDGKIEEVLAPSSKEPDFNPELKIGQIKEALREVYFENREVSLREALTLMDLKNISYLPIVNKKEFDKPVAVLQFDDVITAILREGANLDLPCHSLASDKNPLVLKKNDHLLPHMQKILKKGYALILEDDPRKGFAGIITKRSLCDYLLQNTESFLTLAQIERNLRMIIKSAALSTQQMREAITIDGQPESTKTELHELTFAELRTLLTCEERWPDFNIGHDRKRLTKELEAVNKFRNAVMHFHPRDSKAECVRQLKTAKELNQLLQRVAAQIKRAK